MNKKSGIVFTLVAVLLSLLSAQVQAANYKPTKGATEVMLSPVVINALVSQGITLSKIAPAKLVGQVARFPINGGSVEQPIASQLKASVNHTGGLSFKKKNVTVKVRRFIIDTTAGQLTGNVVANGLPLGRLPLFDLDLSQATIDNPTGKLAVKNVALKLTNTVADALNAAFKVGFVKGLMIGTANVQIDKMKLMK